MKRLIAAVWIIFIVSLAGCTGAVPSDDALAVVVTETVPPAEPALPAADDVDAATALPDPTNTASAPTLESATSTPLPAPTDTQVPASPTPEPSVTPTESPVAAITTDLAISAENILVYPVPQLYTGDRATFQIRAQVPTLVNPNEVFVDIYVGDQLVVNNVNIGGYTNLNGDSIGLYQWVWQPSTPGSYNIRVQLDPDDRLYIGDENPDNNLAEFSIEVEDRASLPPIQQSARWETIETPYAKMHFVTGTAADRDRDYLVATVDAAVLEAANVLGVPPIADRKVEIYFIDRIIGQGGYAGSSMVISYLDRNYAGGGLYEVLVHESIHVLDAPLESDNRVTFLVEGMAVWGTGGHYKPENIDARAAGLLLDTDRYIPLEPLINNFYPSQHEIGYLEAGAFINFLSNTYGWDAVREFYGSTTRQPGLTLAESLSKDLVTHFGKTLAQLEADWHRYLQAVPRRAEDALDLELTITYYDLMREYQQAYDPTAYYLYAWLPYPDALRDQGITADLTRHPNGIVNMALETMLESADIALRNGELARTRVLLDSVERVLDNGGRFIDPLAASYLSLVEKSAELGFVTQNISIFNDTVGPKAIVVATDPNTNQLVTLTLALDGAEWTVSQ